MDNAHLLNQIVAKQSFLCVGLDSDKKKLPACVRQEPDPVFAFNRRIVDATAPYTVAYKPNLAFYEAEGPEGMHSLHRTVEYIKEQYPDIFVIADAKRGDIGNTATLYARAVFEASRFDAVTVAPYMGSDSVQPFLEFADKKVIVLALTSNTGAADFQMMEEASTGQRLFERVLRTASQWGSQEQIMFVVGATRAELLQQVRSIVPNHFLLVPGVGAQGGSLEDVARYGMNHQCGLLVNSSRGIIFADNTERFDLVAGAKAEELQKEMAVLMGQYMNHK